MNEDKIDKLLKSIDLLIEQNNIINEQVTRILFLCLSDQNMNNIKSLIKTLEIIDAKLSKQIADLSDQIVNLSEQISDDYVKLASHIMTGDSDLTNKIIDLDAELVRQITGLSNKITVVESNLSSQISNIDAKL